MSTGGEISNTGTRYYSEPRTHTRHDLDFYIEPAWTVDALLDVETFFGTIWDPACGSGTIVKTCLARGLTAVGSDIADRGFGGVQDFLSIDHLFVNVDAIICNPPYKLGEAFIRRAFTVAPKVAMLVQSKFPYSQKRHALFTQRPPARMYHLSTRPSMPPGEKLLAGTVEAKGGKLDYLWIIWDIERQVGPTETRWLRRSLT